MKKAVAVYFLSMLAMPSLTTAQQVEAPFQSIEALGEALFFDVNLSKERTQSCASCHSPETGFSDPRGAASLGDDGSSLGDRNAPTASYASFSPPFHQRDDGAWIGGQFLDGRASDLMEQAGGPPLNPIEMGLADKKQAVARLAENPEYVRAFDTLFEPGILSRPDEAFSAMTQAIAMFERTDLFAPFDSKYDRFLRGELELSNEEELGRILFFSEQFTNCNLCHQLQRSQIHPQETFSNYEFHNIGVPVNQELRAQNGVMTTDLGLLANPRVDDARQAGKFKVPTLRNVAVTGPYMHNGLFEELRTVVLFYNRYNTTAKARQINPETGKVFGMPEIPQTLATKELTHGPALKDREIDALVAFMKTLTDARYEHLIED